MTQNKISPPYEQSGSTMKDELYSSLQFFKHGGEPGGKTSRGLVRRDFRQIAPNGFGDPYNAYPHAMAWFQDHLYVGTTRANLHYRGKWRSETNPEWLGEIWPVKIPEGLFDIDLRAQIWRYHPPTDKWTMVYISPLVIGIDGFEVPLSLGFRCMAAFQGLRDEAPALYVPTWGSHQTPEAVMLRSSDGVNFEVVNEPGVGFPDPYKPRALRGFVTFKGRLFGAPAVGPQRAEPNTSGYMVIFETRDPTQGQWRLACEPNFGDPNNLTVFDMAVFDGHLYAGTLNINEGFQLWKTDAEGEAPYTWRKVLSHGAYRGKWNQVAMRLAAFKEHLYLGTAVQEGGLDPVNKVSAAPEVIRVSPDDSWDLLVGEARMTPDGLKAPLSGLRAGFGNPFAGYLWTLCQHDGWIYAGDFVWLTLLRYANMPQREAWPAWLKRLLASKNVESMLPKYGGCDLWRSCDGINWVPVTLDGFGNYYNYGIRNMASTPYGLFVGISNPYTPEVAVKRIGGWQYEENPKGGLEIWLGSRDFSGIGQRAESDDISGGEMDNIISWSPRNFKPTESIEELIAQLYGGSDFRNVGFWQTDTPAAQTACENLLDEVLALIPKPAGTILELGCGRGATTGYLAKQVNPGDLTGVTTDRKDLEACRRNAPGVNFVYRRLPKLKFDQMAFDTIISVESMGSFSREKMLREIFQTLKKGGHLVCLDILSEAVLQGRTIKALNFTDPSNYAEALQTIGFQDIQIVDVTVQCLQGFKRNLMKFFIPLLLSGEIHYATFQKVKNHVLPSESVEQRYLMISAIKPNCGA